MSVDPHEAERELRDEPPTAGTTIVDDPKHEAETWEPEPAELRDGETRDDSAHAAANREMIRRAEIEGVAEEGDRDE